MNMHTHNLHNFDAKKNARTKPYSSEIIKKQWLEIVIKQIFQIY